MQVSVPGMYQNPAPYREQTLTYSTALALTGRSAACAPLTATRPAAEPSMRLFTNFIFKPPSCCVRRFGSPPGADTLKAGSLIPRDPRAKAVTYPATDLRLQATKPKARDDIGMPLSRCREMQLTS